MKEETKFKALATILKTLNVDYQTAALIYMKAMKKTGLIDTLITYLRETKPSELTGEKILAEVEKMEK